MNVGSMLSQLLGQAAQSVGIGDPAFERSFHFLAQLQTQAFGPWVQVARSGIGCSVRFRTPDGKVIPCRNAAMGACAVCGNPVCCEHVFAASTGEAVCRACVHHAASQFKQARSPDDVLRTPDVDDKRLRKAYLKRLGLVGSPAAEEIREAYKRMAAKHHPDRFPEQKKRQAHERFIKLGEARDWLLERLQAA